jgi:hypothetical protein
MRFFVPPVLVGGLRRTEARDEAETGAWPEGGVERGGRHGVRHDPDAVGRRAARSCGRAGATPARQPNLFNPTKEALHEVGRTDHDFTQHSVIRSTNERQRSGARVEGAPLGKAATRSGTATDYGCCVMAMDAGGVTTRTL